MILLLVSIALLLLRNNLIPLYQSLNFVLFLSNHPGSGIMFLGTLVCPLFSCVNISAVDILSMYSVVFSEALFVIYKDPSFSDNVSISLSWYWLVLFLVDLTTCVLFLPMVKLSIVLCELTTSVLSFLQGELADALPNVMILSLA